MTDHMRPPSSVGVSDGGRAEPIQASYVTPRNAGRLSSALAAVAIGAAVTGVGMALGYAMYGDGTRISFTFMFVMVTWPMYRRLRAAEEVRNAVETIHRIVRARQ